MIDLSAQVVEAISQGSITNGLCCVSVLGSTAAITTIEFEPGLQRDFPAFLEKLAPTDGRYHHEDKGDDDNGHSHLRASLIGPSLTVPLIDGRPALGIWQQIVLFEFDTRPRDREIVIVAIGE